MILEGHRIKKPLALEADVAVVGSGAGGGVCAKELQEHGLEVVLLEEGGFYTSKDFTQREEEMMPRLYWNAGLTGNRDFSVIIQYGRCAGGSTTHNLALCFRPEPAILMRWAEEYKVESLSYEELVPFIERVERHIGVNPIEESQLNENNRLFKLGADRMGYRGIIPHHNRINCLGSGFCELGCSYDRLQSILITYIPKALQKGTKLVCDARVEKLKRAGRKIIRLEGHILDRKTANPKVPFTVHAKAFVLSCGAIHTPNLLQKSHIHGPFAKSLRLHPYTPIAAIFKHRVNAWEGIPQSYVVDEFAHFKKTGYDGFLMITGFAHPVGFATMIPGAFDSHFDMMQKYPHMAACGAMIHDETRGKIYLKKDGSAAVDYFPIDRDKKHFMDGLKAMAKIMFAAGAKKVIIPYRKPAVLTSEKDLSLIDRRGIEPHEVLIGSVHPQASCPMGEDLRKCFVNSFGQCHTIDNLYIADTSVFCTSLGTPPQIPTMALATRTASYILKQFGKPAIEL